MVNVQSILAVASIAIAAVNGIPTITVKGAKFFAGGQQFFLKGITHGLLRRSKLTIPRRGIPRYPR
jgi:hypothetical protein